VKRKQLTPFLPNNPLSVDCILHFLSFHFKNLSIQSEGLFILHHCIGKCAPEAMREEKGKQQTQPPVFFNLLLKMAFLVTVNKPKLFPQHRYETIPKQRNKQRP